MANLSRKIFALMGIFVILALLPVIPPDARSAQEMSFTRELAEPICEVDTAESARLIAREKVSRMLVDDAAAFLEAETEVRFFGLAGGESRALLAGILRVDILKEDKSGGTITVTARLQADTLETVKALDSVRKDRDRVKGFVAVRKKKDEALGEVERFRKEAETAGKDPSRVARYREAARDLQAMQWALKGLMAAGTNDTEAMDCFTKALEFNPENIDLYAERALAFLRSGLPERAAGDYSKMIALSPEDPSLYMKRAEAFLKMKRPAEAVADLDRALALNPAGADIYYLRGTVNRDEGRLAEAIRDYQRALEINPGHQDAKKDLELCFQDIRMQDPNISYFDALLERRPDHVQAILGRGVVHWKLGHDREAIRDLSRVIELKPSELRAYRLLVLVRGRSGDYDGAVAEYMRIVERDLPGALVYGARDKEYGGEGDSAQVARDFQSSLKVRARNAPEFLYRGIIRLERGDYEDAISDFIHASGLEPGDARPYIFRGIALGRMGNFNQSAVFFSTALEKDPECASAYALRGVARSLLGDGGGSLQDLKSAAKRGHKGAKDMLKAKGYPPTGDCERCR
ncbi:MAG TPA: tetratricopeptide repeat protein [Syntrophales bacterium]|nr:tetratricopeptide repeat protein [Syntrophales bacterium]